MEFLVCTARPAAKALNIRRGAGFQPAMTAFVPPWGLTPARTPALPARGLLHGRRSVQYYSHLWPYFLVAVVLAWMKLLTLLLSISVAPVSTKLGIVLKGSCAQRPSREAGLWW